MTKWLVRAVSLYVFNVAVLLLIGLLMRSVGVGWGALWASVILTLATLALKPTLLKFFRRTAAKSTGSRTKVGEKVVQYALVFVVELIVWILTVILSGVTVNGWFWGYVLPPVYLLIAWVIYDQIDDRFEAKTGQVIGSAQAKMASRRSARSAPAEFSPGSGSTTTAAAGRDELRDGLTSEQRRMLDEL